MVNIKGGSKVWFVADGWMPLEHETKDVDYRGHEAIMILNTNNKDAEVLMDIYFEKKEPIEGIRLVVPARRIRCFRMDHPDEIGGIKIGRM